MSEQSPTSGYWNASETIDELRAGNERLTAEIAEWKQAAEMRLDHGFELVAEIERLCSQRETLRADNDRLRALLSAVVQEADRSTRAFDEARAALAERKL